jgi:hypothetical protein
MGPLPERHASCGEERFVAHGEDRRFRKIALGGGGLFWGFLALGLGFGFTDCGVVWLEALVIWMSLLCNCVVERGKRLLELGWVEVRLRMR